MLAKEVDKSTHWFGTYEVEKPKITSSLLTSKVDQKANQDFEEVRGKLWRRKGGQGPLLITQGQGEDKKEEESVAKAQQEIATEPSEISKTKVLTRTKRETTTSKGKSKTSPITHAATTQASASQVKTYAKKSKTTDAPGTSRPTMTNIA